MRAERNTAENFWQRTEPQGECVVWTGGKDPAGYGRLNWEGRPTYAHRLAFFLRMGRWPEGILRHLCNNPPCVLHAVEGTHRQNAWDSVFAGNNPQANKTHCHKGHPFDNANTYWYRDWRFCRACDRERHAARRARRAA